MLVVKIILFIRKSYNCAVFLHNEKLAEQIFLGWLRHLPPSATIYPPMLIKYKGVYRYMYPL